MESIELPLPLSNRWKLFSPSWNVKGNHLIKQKSPFFFVFHSHTWPVENNPTTFTKEWKHPIDKGYIWLYTHRPPSPTSHQIPRKNAVFPREISIPQGIYTSHKWHALPSRNLYNQPSTSMYHIIVQDLFDFISRDFGFWSEMVLVQLFSHTNAWKHTGVGFTLSQFCVHFQTTRSTRRSSSHPSAK